MCFSLPGRRGKKTLNDDLYCFLFCFVLCVCIFFFFLFIFDFHFEEVNPTGIIKNLVNVKGEKNSA
jgi:hypothetical protein